MSTRSIREKREIPALPFQPSPHRVVDSFGLRLPEGLVPRPRNEDPRFARCREALEELLRVAWRTDAVLGPLREEEGAPGIDPPDLLQETVFAVQEIRREAQRDPVVAADPLSGGLGEGGEAGVEAAPCPNAGAERHAGKMPRE